MEQGKDAQTILGFLHNFRNRLYFDSFFNLCYRRTVGTLKYLKNKGIPIPLDQYAGEDPLSDIAIDILGSYFKSMPGKPFYAIFNQFKNCDINDTGAQGLEEIHDHFVSTFYVFIKQELSRILNESDPQVSNIKRRITDIIHGPEYEVFTKANIQYVSFNHSSSDRRNEKSLIAYEELENLSESSYHKNRPQWCKNIFDSLSLLTEFRNCVKKYDLIRSMVNVVMKYAELEGMPQSHCTFDRIKSNETAINNSKEASLVWLSDEVLKKFIEKEKISAKTSTRFLLAADYYLSDLIYSPGVDLLPVYFREVMPEQEHGDYLKDYKYIFETSMEKVKDNFINRIKISTNLSFSNYYGDEGDK